jgi:hypothetical protein
MAASPTAFGLAASKKERETFNGEKFEGRKREREFTK